MTITQIRELVNPFGFTVRAMGYGYGELRYQNLVIMTIDENTDLLKAMEEFDASLLSVKLQQDKRRLIRKLKRVQNKQKNVSND